MGKLAHTRWHHARDLQRHHHRAQRTHAAHSSPDAGDAHAGAVRTVARPGAHGFEPARPAATTCQRQCDDRRRCQHLREQHPKRRPRVPGPRHRRRQRHAAALAGILANFSFFLLSEHLILIWFG